MGDTTIAKQESAEPRQVFEVLTRRPDGHETVHRFAAADAEEAKSLAVEAGVPADQIVDAAVEDGGQGARTDLTSPNLGEVAKSEPANSEDLQNSASAPRGAPEPEPEASDRPTKPEKSH